MKTFAMASFVGSVMSGFVMAACAATSPPPADPASSPATTAAPPATAPATTASAPAAPAPSAASTTMAMTPPHAHKADFTPPTTEADCKKCNGQWAKHGKAQITSCICATSDSGKACKTSEDCDDQCEIALDEAKKYEGVKCTGATCTGGTPNTVIPDGKCNAFRDHFGCRATIEVVKSEPNARHVRSLCVD